MPTKAVLIRFPDGDYEYEATRRDIPSLGETMRRKGQLWTVTRITGDGPATVHVEPVPGSQLTGPDDVPPETARLPESRQRRF